MNFCLYVHTAVHTTYYTTTLLMKKRRIVYTIVYTKQIMPRISMPISFRSDQKSKIDKLLEHRGLIAKVCQDAIDRYFEVPQGEEEIQQMLEEKELIVREASTQIEFLEGRLQKVLESKAHEEERKKKQKEKESMWDEKKKKDEEEIRSWREEQERRENEERAARERRAMAILDLVKETTDFPLHFAKKFVKEFIERMEPMGTELVDALLTTANANNRCFDRDKFLEMTAPQLIVESIIGEEAKDL